MFFYFTKYSFRNGKVKIHARGEYNGNEESSPLLNLMLKILSSEPFPIIKSCYFFLSYPLSWNCQNAYPSEAERSSVAILREDSTLILPSIIVLVAKC